MLTTVDLDEQLEQVKADALRVLVVGAGIAGLTVARLLRQQGLHPVLVDHAEPDSDAGYMLALMPMVDRVIDTMDARSDYLARSTALSRFRFRSHTGRIMREDSMDELLSKYGDYRGISRGDLVDVLSGNDTAVTWGSTVSHVDETTEGAAATISTSDGGSRAAVFDVVVGADGMHSTTRALILDDADVETVDTGWGGWVVWADTDSETDLGEELWGCGFFVGSYPVRDRLGVFVGGPRSRTHGGPASFVEEISAELKHSDGRIERVLDTVRDATHPYFWALTDVRTTSWSDGRVVLVGDAAAGFLPTAGIGAGMAMESAYVLADLLHGTGRSAVRGALERYEGIQRDRVEAAQDNSRKLAKLVFGRSRVLAAVRDALMGLVSVKVALRPIERLLAESPRTRTPAPSRIES